MASTKEYLDFIIEQLSGMDEISYRAMMGEYTLYYRGRVFGGIYDDRLLVKPVPTAAKLMPDAPMELPYDGAKEMILVDDVDNREFLCKLVESMWRNCRRGKGRIGKSGVSYLCDGNGSLKQRAPLERAVCFRLFFCYG